MGILEIQVTLAGRLDSLFL